MRHVTVFLDESRRAVMPAKAVWVVDVELEQDGTVTQETWRRVANAELAQPFKFLGDAAGETNAGVAVG
jgi:hypothetical protein